MLIESGMQTGFKRPCHSWFRAMAGRHDNSAAFAASFWFKRGLATYPLTPVHKSQDQSAADPATSACPQAKAEAHAH